MYRILGEHMEDIPMKFHSQVNKITETLVSLTEEQKTYFSIIFYRIEQKIEIAKNTNCKLVLSTTRKLLIQSTTRTYILKKLAVFNKIIL